jgi:hypothetical protein
MNEIQETKRIKHLRLFKIRFFLTHGRRLKEGITISEIVVWNEVGGS